MEPSRPLAGQPHHFEIASYAPVGDVTTPTYTTYKTGQKVLVFMCYVQVPISFIQEW